MTKRAMPIDKAIGTRIREVRKKCGMTLGQLGSAVGVSEQAISQYELGKRPVQTELVTMIAEKLDVSANHLLSGADQNMTQPATAEMDVFDAVKQAIEDYWDAEDVYKKDKTKDSTIASAWTAALKRVEVIAKQSKMTQQVFDKLWEDAARRHGGIVIRGNRFDAYPKEGSATNPAIFDVLSGDSPKSE